MEKQLKQTLLTHFKCQQSGRCCTCPGIVYVSKNEQLAMSQSKGMPLFEFQREYVITQNGHDAIATPRFRTRCFLDADNKCTVYEARPAQCKTYPNWPEIWEDKARIKREIQNCKGLQYAYQTAFLSENKNPLDL